MRGCAKAAKIKQRKDESMKIRGRGFAIITGLFAVILMYMLATFVLATVSHNFGFTRYGLDSVRSRYLARAALNRALHDLNAPGSDDWETKYRSERLAFTQTYPDGSLFKVWMERIPNPFGGFNPHRVRLIAVGTFGNRSERVETLICKRPAVEQVVYAVQNDFTRPSDPPGVDNPRIDRIYSNTDGANLNWSRISPPPDEYLDQHSNTRVPLPAGRSLRFSAPVCDCGERLYCVAGNAYGHDEVWKFNPNESVGPLWTTLPPPTSGFLPDGKPEQQIVGLAINHGEDLFALVRSTTDETYSIKHLNPNDVASTWTTLPALPAGKISQLCADDVGHVYFLCDNPLPDSTRHCEVWRYRARGADWVSGKWMLLEQPESVDFEIIDPDAKPLRYQSKAPQPPQPEFQLVCLAVERSSGQVFTQGQRSPGEVSTIYRFTPHGVGGGIISGTWTTDPLPPPGWYWDSARHLHFTGKYTSLRNSIVDQSSHFMGIWGLPGRPDSILQTDLTSKKWRPWRPVTFSPTGNVTALGGGGKQIGAYPSQYVPITTY